MEAADAAALVHSPVGVHAPSQQQLSGSRSAELEAGMRPSLRAIFVELVDIVRHMCAGHSFREELRRFGTLCLLSGSWRVSQEVLIVSSLASAASLTLVAVSDTFPDRTSFWMICFGIWAAILLCLVGLASLRWDHGLWAPSLLVDRHFRWKTGLKALVLFTKFCSVYQLVSVPSSFDGLSQMCGGTTYERIIPHTTLECQNKTALGGVGCLDGCLKCVQWPAMGGPAMCMGCVALNKTKCAKRALESLCPAPGPMINCPLDDGWQKICTRYAVQGGSRELLIFTTWFSLFVVAASTLSDVVTAWCSDEFRSIAKWPRGALTFYTALWILNQVCLAVLIVWGPGIFAFELGEYPNWDSRQMTPSISFMLVSAVPLMNEVARVTQRSRFSSLDSLGRIRPLTFFAFAACIFVNLTPFVGEWLSIVPWIATGALADMWIQASASLNRQIVRILAFEFLALGVFALDVVAFKSGSLTITLVVVAILILYVSALDAANALRTCRVFGVFVTLVLIVLPSIIFMSLRSCDELMFFDPRPLCEGRLPLAAILMSIVLALRVAC
jgi:uncharacterized membrane protein